MTNEYLDPSLPTFEIQKKPFFAAGGISVAHALIEPARLLIEKANAAVAWTQAVDIYNDKLSDVPFGATVGLASTAIVGFLYGTWNTRNDYREVRNVSAATAGAIAILPVVAEAALELYEGDPPSGPAQVGLLIGSAMFTAGVLIGPGIKTAPDAWA